MTNNPEEYKKAAEKAMSLLLVQERTRKDLTDRLRRAGFSEEAAAYALEYVMGYGYVDDLRFAENYLAFHKNRRSRKELCYKMMGKGVPADVIARAMEDYCEEDERIAAAGQLEKRLKGRALASLDKKEREKIMAYLAGKGYPFPVIRQVMQEREQQDYP